MVERVGVLAEVLLGQPVYLLYGAFGGDFHDSALTVAMRQAFAGSTTLTATRGSRRMFLSFWLPPMMLIATCSPSVSTHTWVIWGEPSGMSVATWQKAGSPSNFLNPGEMACGKTPPLGNSTTTEGYSTSPSPAHNTVDHALQTRDSPGQRAEGYRL